MTRRSAFALPALAGLGMRRRKPVAMYPDSEGIFFETIIVGQGGVFVYSSVFPQNGTLVASIAGNSGTDPYGNAYVGGIVSYGHSGGQVDAIQIAGNAIEFRHASTVAGPFTGEAVISAPTGTTKAELDLTASYFSFASSLTSGLLEFLFPSGDATGATDTSNLAAVLAAGGTPVLLPGTFNINCGDATLTDLGPGQYIIGCGDLNTIINAHGAGDVFRWFHTGSISDGTTTGGGFIGGGTIDGSACSGAATGIHAGDINALRFDVRCQHFNQTGGSWNFFFENRNFFTERMHINIRSKDGGFGPGDGGHVGFNVGGALTSTGSFARLQGIIEFTAGNNQQDFLVLNNGAHIYDFADGLALVGNHQAGAPATTAAGIRIIGSVPAGHPGAGAPSQISNGTLGVGLECSAGANAPITIVQGSSSNSIRDCEGNMNWNSNWTSSGITGAGFKYNGMVQGDPALGTRLYYGTAPTQTIIANGQTISSTVPSAKIPISAGGAGFTGAILSPGDVDGQLIYLIGTGSVGANVTFAVAGTSNVANGTSAVIIPNTMMALMWDAASALWYPAS